MCTTAASAQSPTPSELVAALQTRQTAWVATAQLQSMPQAALPLLLAPGGLVAGPHGAWSASMLALAKLGDPAIPAITAAVVPLVKAGDYKAVAGMGPLVEVLGSMGPAAVPALLEIAEASSVPYVTANALDQIAGMEPRAIVFGQFMSPWMFWHPADGRVDALQRALVPQLPRVRRLLERVRPFWTPESHTPDRMAAYLLARWGTGEGSWTPGAPGAGRGK
jgi:hypothetical protein